MFTGGFFALGLMGPIAYLILGFIVIALLFSGAAVATSFRSNSGRKGVDRIASSTFSRLRSNRCSLFRCPMLGSTAARRFIHRHSARDVRASSSLVDMHR